MGDGSPARRFEPEAEAVGEVKPCVALALAHGMRRGITRFGQPPHAVAPAFEPGAPRPAPLPICTVRGYSGGVPKMPSRASCLDRAAGLLLRVVSCWASRPVTAHNAVRGRRLLLR
jgi:hypothetical protein